MAFWKSARGERDEHCRSCGQLYLRFVVRKDQLRGGSVLQPEVHGPTLRLGLRGDGAPVISVCPAGHEGYLETKVAGRQERAYFDGALPTATELEAACAPEGTGSELQAGVAPEGTGSELESA